MKIVFLKQILLCFNSFSKLKKTCLMKDIFILQLMKKCSKRNFLEQKYIFFENVPRFARKHFWASEHCFEPIPNLLGHLEQKKLATLTSLSCIEVENISFIGLISKPKDTQ